MDTEGRGVSVDECKTNRNSLNKHVLHKKRVSAARLIDKDDRRLYDFIYLIMMWFAELLLITYDELQLIYLWENRFIKNH